MAHPRTGRRTRARFESRFRELPHPSSAGHAHAARLAAEFASQAFATPLALVAADALPQRCVTMRAPIPPPVTVGHTASNHFSDIRAVAYCERTRLGDSAPSVQAWGSPVTCWRTDTVRFVRRKIRVSTWILLACGIWLVGLGMYFIVLRPPLLPEDPRFMGTTLEEIRTALPGLESWLRRVFAVMGGFMAGTGVLTAFLAAVAMPRRFNGTSWAIGISGALTVGLMSAINLSLSSDFRCVLVVPAALWLAGFLFYVSGH